MAHNVRHMAISKWKQIYIDLCQTHTQLPIYFSGQHLKQRHQLLELNWSSSCSVSNCKRSNAKSLNAAKMNENCRQRLAVSSKIPCPISSTSSSNTAPEIYTANSSINRSNPRMPTLMPACLFHHRHHPHPVTCRPTNIQLRSNKVPQAIYRRRHWKFHCTSVSICRHKFWR